MKETMLKRIPLMLLLRHSGSWRWRDHVAHARDAVVAPPGFEARHDARCAILHDELRCALCHYASARVVRQQVFTFTTPRAAVRVAPVQPVVVFAAVVRLTAPARAPPPFLS